MSFLSGSPRHVMQHGFGFLNRPDNCKSSCFFAFIFKSGAEAGNSLDSSSALQWTLRAGVTLEWQEATASAWKPQRVLGSTGPGLDGPRAGQGGPAQPHHARLVTRPVPEKHEWHWRTGRGKVNGDVRRAGSSARIYWAPGDLRAAPGHH